jgi:hypothetical protein
LAAGAADGDQMRRKEIIGCVFTLFAFACSAPPGRSGSLSEGLSTTPALMYWIVPGEPLDYYLQNGGNSQLVNAIFNNARTFIYPTGNTSCAYNSSVPNSVKTHKWPDEVTMESELAGCESTNHIEAAHLDLEAWPQTPPVEQREFVRFYGNGADFVHNQGPGLPVTPFLATPAMDLVPDRTCDTFNANNYPTLIAKKLKAGDAYEIQAQNQTDFDTCVQKAAGQVKLVNPNILVLAGIKLPDGATTMFNEVKAAFGTVSGFWLNMANLTSNDISTLTSFLQMIYDAYYVSGITSSSTGAEQ